MGWQRNYVVLQNGERVRYSLLQRGTDIYRVRFKGGLRKIVEVSTGRARKADAIEEAHRIILEEFGHISPPAERMPWEEARARLEEAMLADGKRPRTVKEYLKSLKHLADLFPLAKGPADISPGIAEHFKTKYATGRTIRKKRLKKGEVAKSHRRRPETLDSQLRMLKAAFTWFVRLRLAEANPFEKVTFPELDRHEVKYVRQEDVLEFF